MENVYFTMLKLLVNKKNFQFILQGMYYININIYVIIVYSYFNNIFIFTREVLASPKLLNLQNRIDWRKCEQTTEEEENGVKMFRKAFAPYNPIED